MKKRFLLITLIGLSFGIQAQTHHFELTKFSEYFENGTSNQVAYIDFGDIKFWGYFEITLTGSYNHQNTVGKYSKRYQIGKNVGTRLYAATSEIPTTFGLVANQWKLGEAKLNEKNHLIIPIYHLVSTGNRILVNIKGISTANVDNLEKGIKITTPITIENSETRDYVTYDSQVNFNENIKGPGVESSITNFKNIIGRSSDGILHLRAGNSTGSIFLNYYEKGNILLANGGGNVGIGTLKPDSKLTVAGNIHSKEVKVTATAGGADFVFENNYNLPTLSSIESFVKKNKHLPEIPSAQEMEKKGLNLAEMNIKLLQKIEELTLYTIEQDKKLRSQENKFNEQSSKIENQQKEIEKLKKQNSEIKELKALVQKLLKDKN